MCNNAFAKLTVRLLKNSLKSRVRGSRSGGKAVSLMFLWCFSSIISCLNSSLVVGSKEDSATIFVLKQLRLDVVTPFGAGAFAGADEEEDIIRCV